MNNRGTGAKSPANQRGLFTRLGRDISGNVLAMTAAAVIPMIGIVGGAVDMSRAYRAKARLQAACDSGVLAGRRAMSDLTYTTQARDRANKMFNFNYVPADYQASGTTFTTSANAEGVVSGTAVSNIPMALMQVFGYNNFNLSVTCSADFQVPNIDTMMVLDVTGSMADCPDNSNCNSGAGSKIVGLRSAVRSFYTTLQAAAANSPRTQLRYGFVPYSQAVNLGDIFASTPAAHQLPLSQLVDAWDIPSRVANFNTPVTTPWAVDPDETPQTYLQRFDKDVAASKQPFANSGTTGTNISNGDCDRYSNNRSFNIGGINLNVMLYPYESSGYIDNYGVSELYQAEGQTTWQTNEPTTGNRYTKITFSRVSGTWNDNSGAQTANYQKCQRRVTHTVYSRSTKYAFTSWTYKNVNYDLSSYKSGTGLQYVSAINTGTARLDAPTDLNPLNPVQLRQLANQTGFTSATATWNGCIEERDTVAADTFTPIPSGALDLDYLSLGTNNASKWRPTLFDLSWMRSGPAEETDTNNGRSWRPGRTCPVARARNLLPMTLAEIDAYLPTLQAAGNTYHDFGMLWGLRLISPNGIFASRNVTGANGGQISRHIIFMTDGVLVTGNENYGLYGIERVTQRITGGSTNPSHATRHARRFQALCDAARSQGLSVWVIAFGTAITSNLTSCADPGRAYQASNTAQLTARFQQIANDIADLRLTQ